MDDLHDLLTGSDGLQDRLAQRPFLHAAQEFACDLEVDVRFQQHAPDLAEALLDHGLGENTSLAQLLERAVELGTEFVEHEADPPDHPWDVPPTGGPVAERA